MEQSLIPTNEDTGKLCMESILYLCVAFLNSKYLSCFKQVFLSQVFGFKTSEAFQCSYIRIQLGMFFPFLFYVHISLTILVDYFFKLIKSFHIWVISKWLKRLKLTLYRIFSVETQQFALHVGDRNLFLLKQKCPCLCFSLFMFCLLGLGYVKQNMAELHLSVPISPDTLVLRDARVCFWIHV